jgi:hypothetical protein
LEILVVAAKNANLRATPQGKAKVVGVLPRGTTITVLDESDGFVKCNPMPHIEGWIARTVLVAEAEATRLAGVSADVYVESRRRLHVLEKVRAHVEAHRPQLIALVVQASARPRNISDAIRQLEAEPKPTDIAIDPPAGLWFSLEARAMLDAGSTVESTRSALAAVFADPLNADYYTALGYAAIKSGDKEIVSAAAQVLLTLAPGSTNSWVIVGVAAALEDNPFATDALAVAIERSRSKPTTLKVLKEIASQTLDTRIRSAIDAALEEVNTSESAAPIAGRGQLTGGIARKAVNPETLA